MVRYKMLNLAADASPKLGERDARQCQCRLVVLSGSITALVSVTGRRL